MSLIGSSLSVTVNKEEMNKDSLPLYNLRGLNICVEVVLANHHNLTAMILM